MLFIEFYIWPSSYFQGSFKKNLCLCWIFHPSFQVLRVRFELASLFLLLVCIYFDTTDHLKTKHSDFFGIWTTLISLDCVADESWTPGGVMLLQVLISHESVWDLCERVICSSFTWSLGINLPWELIHSTVAPQQRHQSLTAVPPRDTTTVISCVNFLWRFVPRELHKRRLWCKRPPLPALETMLLLHIQTWDQTHACFVPPGLSA